MPASFLSRLGVPSSGFDPDCRLVSSSLFINTPLVLALLRLSVAGYTLVVLLFVVIWESVKVHDGQQFFSFFTHLSYIGVCSYFLASGIQTFSYAQRARKGGDGYLLQRWSKWLQALHVLLLSTIVVYPIVVTIIYWALLSSNSFATTYSSWSKISMHALNSVFALFEILFTNVPPLPWMTLPFGILSLAGYLGIAYITKATQGFYTYSFLDPSKQHALLAAYIVGIAVAECVIFAIVRGIMVLRQRYCAKRGLLERRNAASPEDIEEWEEIDRPKTPV